MSVQKGDKALLIRGDSPVVPGLAATRSLTLWALAVTLAVGGLVLLALPRAGRTPVAVVVAIAAFNLLLDFDLIEKGVAARAPAYMDWYAAFGLIVTIVWLYLEILRLIAKLRSD